MSNQATVKQLASLQYSFVNDEMAVREIAIGAGLKRDDADRLSSALVIVGDGDYEQVWLSYHSVPWLEAVYYAPKWFDDSLAEYEPVKDAQNDFNLPTV